jgi:glycosyltransferase involved in cell wall biosynthesis
MTFSIIIPLYNKEHFVKATIDSVIAQTFQDWEAIIINDGSTDKSADIISEYKDSRIKYYEHENCGVSATRNQGLRLAKGEFIAFLDADDLWQPVFLEKLNELTLNYPEQSFFCCTQTNRIMPNLPSGVTIIDDLCKYDYIYSTGCSIIRRSIFEELGGFKEGVQLGEDRDMWLRIGCKYKTVYLNEGLMLHPDTTENNLSNSIDVTNSFPYWEWFSYSYPNKSSLYKYTNKMLISNAKTLIQSKRYKEAWFYLRKCKGIYSIKARIDLLYKLLLAKQ